MECCQEVIQPNRKLKKMYIVLKLIVIFNIILMVLQAYIIEVAPSFTDFFNILFLILAIMTGFYLYAVFYIFFNLFNVITSFVSLGTLIQNHILNNDEIQQKILLFGLISIFFYSFSIYIVFNTYKEMKAILIEDSEGQELEDNINTKVKSFKAFSGKGVMVGGN
jgi:hypothetical protein